MSTKHETKIHAIPTKIKLEPITDAGANKYSNDSQTHCVFEKDGEYEIGFFDTLQLKEKRKKFKIYVSNSPGMWSWNSVEEIEVGKVFTAYFENKYKTFFDESALRKFKEYIGTNKTIYFDMIKSCRQDFTYDRPYVQFFAQPKIKNRHLDLREKFADVLSITITVDELDNELFKKIQEHAIEKYGVIAGVDRVYDRKKAKTKPCEVIDEIPIKLRNGKLDFSNRISFIIYDGHIRKTPYIVMKAGKYHHEMGFSKMYMKTIYEDIESLDQIDALLNDLQRYTRLIPKIKSPWHYY